MISNPALIIETSGHATLRDVCVVENAADDMV
jgi:hypothetical protein